MAEVRTSEFAKYRSELLDAHADLKVWLWDHGPEEPILPEPPELPSGKDGDPKHDLAKIQFKRALKTYEAALEKYEADTIAFAKWQRDNGGPIEIIQWSVDAKDTFIHDARAVAEGRQKKLRYSLSGRTRGYDRMKTGNKVVIGFHDGANIRNIDIPLGLQKNEKPGHGHEAAVARQLAGEAEFIHALRSDPVFGQEVRS